MSKHTQVFDHVNAGNDNEFKSLRKDGNLTSFSGPINGLFRDNYNHHWPVACPVACLSLQIWLFYFWPCLCLYTIPLVYLWHGVVRVRKVEINTKGENKAIPSMTEAGIRIQQFNVPPKKKRLLFSPSPNLRFPLGRAIVKPACPEKWAVIPHNEQTPSILMCMCAGGGQQTTESATQYEACCSRDAVSGK